MFLIILELFYHIQPCKLMHKHAFGGQNTQQFCLVLYCHNPYNVEKNFQSVRYSIYQTKKCVSIFFPVCLDRLTTPPRKKCENLFLWRKQIVFKNFFSYDWIIRKYKCYTKTCFVDPKSRFSLLSRWFHNFS